MVESATPALNRSRETRAATQSGYLMLLIWLLLLGVAAWAGITNANAEYMVAWKWIVVAASAIAGLLMGAPGAVWLLALARGRFAVPRRALGA